MSSMSVMPREAEWTVKDLEALPDDGLQYELLDGILLVSPAPVGRHQRACARLFLLLAAACPPELEVFFAPLDWQPDGRTSLQPDLLVIAKGDADFKAVHEPLTLAVEVLSPSTHRKDQLLKRSKYEEAGVTGYWIVDPDEPAVLALDLVAGQYVVAGRATGSESLTLTHPFPVTVTPGALVD